MTLENSSTEKLIELLTLLNDNDISFVNSIKQEIRDEKLLRDYLIETNIEILFDNGYDGDNNYDSMYWFAKGLNIPSPQPLQRYIDTDEYKNREQKRADDELFKNINKYKETDKIHDFKHKQLQTKFKQQRIKEVNDYNKWKRNNEEQDQIIKEIMENLERTPTNWEIDFERLNNYGRKKIFPLLLNFFNENIATLPIIEKYKIQYKVNGIWYTKQLNPENYNKLMNNFTEENFIFNIDQKPPEYFYEQGGQDLPDWSLFSAIRFTKFIHYNDTSSNRSNNDIGGSFFQYLTTDKVPVKIIEYLKRLQIFDSLLNDKGIQREELNDCCFIYALKQTGSYTDDVLNKIRLRINNRYLSQSSINSLCEEFKIKIKLSYINENDSSNKKRIIHSTKNKSRKSFMGYNDAEPQHTHTFNIFENHADFEADVSGDIHKPFMCVLQSQNGKINKEFRGENCNIQLLEYLPDGAVIYFHNLAYDLRMLAQYGLCNSIIKGTKTMRADIKYKDESNNNDIKYNGKLLYFRDSLPILSCKLSQLPQMFNIPNIHKEIFPYKYYTIDRLKSNIGSINEAGLLEAKIWTAEDYKLFNSNIDKIPGCRIDENHFDMWKYASFYCQQDVNILRLGFNEFRNGFIKDFDIDPFNYISISSLANEVFNKKVFYPNGNLYKIGGHVRKFCSHAVYGGRCMTAYNKKWHTTKPLSDFDAVSLYPSAMARLYTVEGKPQVINVKKVNAKRDEFLKYFQDKGAYIVEIKITKVNKHYPFPLIVRKVNGLNLNDDNLAEGETLNMVVDNITLEDLIEYQQIEFEILRGYAWFGKRDYTIQKEIRKIFNKRLEYKKQKNPLQQLYKLIMNSCYGKTIERPVDKDYKYFDNEEALNKYWIKNYYKIIDDVKIANSSIHAVKTLRPIDKHFNFSLLGIQVLSMSKRIMNEVMCLAFDIGCHIYYQDTDSMHIEVDDLPKLVKAFREKYNRELIGSNLGQFHSDFPTINNHDEMPVSIESYFLMKKMYIDKLQDSTGQIDYMIRGKGLTQASIKYAADRWYHANYMELYRSIYDGKCQTFDLTKGQPCFAMNKNMTISTVKSFTRTIKTTYEEGKRSEYFII